MHSLILGVLKSVKKFLTFPPLIKLITPMQNAEVGIGKRRVEASDERPEEYGHQAQLESGAIGEKICCPGCRSSCQGPGRSGPSQGGTTG